KFGSASRPRLCAASVKISILGYRSASMRLVAAFMFGCRAFASDSNSAFVTTVLQAPAGFLAAAVLPGAALSHKPTIVMTGVLGPTSAVCFGTLLPADCD